MGIKGIYKEIGPGERVSISKYAIEHWETTGRPLRLAIDISIWLFQIQSGKGGKSPALRTFYYRLLRLISNSIHPLFVFDGPNKPPFKRNKKTGANFASIPEYLARDLLKRFRLPIHQAPGEAEAECALLQRLGVVDAVLSEDVDTLMFGSGLTMRNWTSEGGNSKKVPTHVNLYDAVKTKSGDSGLDREGMILVAMMSGGDYIPEGVPGCGAKTACEAARAGFGADLCKLSRNDMTGLADWKERLCHELQTNESKFFRQRHMKLAIPEDFPRLDILKYYTHPCVSSEDQLRRLPESLKWDEPFDIPALRSFTAEAFEWLYLGGAKKFVRNLAPALLVRELRLRGSGNESMSDDLHDVAEREKQIVECIYKKRNHADVDEMTELRLGFYPLRLVPVDLDAEEPDPILAPDDNESDEEAAEPPPTTTDMPASPRKRGPPAYDPTALDNAWVAETLVKVGIPLKVQDWEEAFRNPKKYERMKAANRKAGTSKRSKKVVDAEMPSGAMDRFTKVTKPVGAVPAKQLLNDDVTGITPAAPSLPEEFASTAPQFIAPPSLPASPPRSTSTVIEILSSPDTQPRPRKRQMRRSQSAIIPGERCITPPLPIDNKEKNSLFCPLPALPPSVTIRRHRAPLQRSRTIASAGRRQTPEKPLREIDNPNSSSQDSDKSLCKHPDFPQIAAPDLMTIRDTSKTTVVIEVGSSPSTAPVTPSRIRGTSIMSTGSRQRLITDWLPPSRQRGRDGASKTPGRVSPNINTRNAAQMTPIVDRAEPPSPTPKQRTRGRLAVHDEFNVFRDPASFLSPNATSPLPPPPRPLEAPSSGMPSITVPILSITEPTTTAPKATVIRIRESQEGAWATELGSSPDSSSMNGSGQVRMTNASNRRWRVSQVEVLDLTDE